MGKTEKIRLIYAIFLGVFSVAVGIAVICVAADIYYTGKGTGVIYSREIVGERLSKLAIPLILLVGAIIAGAVFPLYKVRQRPTSENAVKKLASRMPSGGEGEEFDAAQKAFNKTKYIRLGVWLAALAVALAAAIAVLCYVLDRSNFPGADVTEEIFALVRFVLPFTAAALVSLSAAAVYNGVLAQKQLNALKKMIKSGNGECAATSDPAFVSKVKSVWNSAITLWAVRGVLLVLAITFIIVGIFNGGANDVLVKAINICQECIGLG